MKETISSLYHVTSLENAIRILQDGAIMPRPIKKYIKEEKWNRRVSAIWILPNQFPESFFGTVEFSFCPKKVISYSELYGIGKGNFGSGNAYYRILVGNDTFSKKHIYKPKGNGSFKIKKKEFSYKGYIQLLITRKICLRDCAKLRFVNHYKGEYQNREIIKCADQTRNQFLSWILAFGETLNHENFCIVRILEYRDVLEFVKFLEKEIKKIDRNKDFKGTIRSNDSTAKPILISAFNFFWLSNLDGFSAMLSLFQNKKQLKITLYSRLEKVFPDNTVEKLKKSKFLDIGKYEKKSKKKG